VGGSRGWNISWTARKAGLMASACGVAALWLGCTEPKPNSTVPPNGNFYSVATNSTGFFSYDPHQEVGPDKMLRRDTVVVLLRPSFGYSVVRLMTGEQGFVSSKDLRVAPAALIPKAAPTPRPSGPAIEVYSPKPTPAQSPPPPSEIEPAPLPNPPHNGQ
jgi:hypothetical protein